MTIRLRNPPPPGRQKKSSTMLTHPPFLATSPVVTVTDAGWCGIVAKKAAAATSFVARRRGLTGLAATAMIAVIVANSRGHAVAVGPPLFLLLDPIRSSSIPPEQE